MPVETEIRGDAGAVLGAASWAADTLGPRVEGGAGALRRARNGAESDWEGTAGTAFAARMGTGTRAAEDFQASVVETARALETCGHELRIAQERMAEIRRGRSRPGWPCTVP